jgi:WD40 repeat protein
VLSCSWSLDGTKVASCSEDKTVCVWDVNRGECIATLTGHAGMVNYCQLRKKYGCSLTEWVQVTSCSWSPDGTKVVSSSADKTLRVWDVSRGECIITLIGHNDTVSYCQLE